MTDLQVREFPDAGRSDGACSAGSRRREASIVYPNYEMAFRRSAAFGLLLSSSAGYRIALEIEVCVAAFVVVAQAIRNGKYMWGMAFLALALLFNPALPVPLTHRIFLGLEWFSIGAFLISLAALRTMPILSIPSVTGRTPGSESL
jgi:hypothetical protein